MEHAEENDPTEVDDVTEELDEETEKKTTTTTQASLTQAALQNPQVLAALQERLNSMRGVTSGYVENLPAPVKRRIKALKKLQAKHSAIEAMFYEEIHQLEVKYALLYAPTFDRRRDIVNGAIEPTDSDCDWQSDDDADDDEADSANPLADKLAVSTDELKEKASTEENTENKDVVMVGVPEFWLTVFKNVDILSDMVQEHDEPILKFLQDIRVVFSQPDEPMGFTLEFLFVTNPHFTDTLLTKHYKMRAQPDESDLLGFEGPEIVGSTGCKIDWQKNMNVTVKLIKKKQKHKQRGQTRTVTKTVKNDSFFNFFDTQKAPTDGEELDADTEALLAADFEIGHFFRERVVPRAVLYFTGEAVDDDDYEEEEEDEDAEGEEGDDEDDPTYNPTGEKPAECNQQ